MLPALLMARDPKASRDVRPVIAGGICLIAVILAWPLVGGDDPSDPPPAPRVAATPVVSTPPRAPAPPGPGTSSIPPSPQRTAPASPPAPKTGIGVFPPPGTSPPKPGIIVPDDYELPPGYVRHHQTTDDGQQLQPILMFHPDFQPVDDRGRPIPVPEDRVVPPELAPPGLAREVLEVPPANVPLVEESDEDATPEPAP
jgi:hypothetical protein